MRPERTDIESTAIEKLVSYLNVQGENWAEDNTITDAPDLVLHKDEKRVGCEITAIGLNELHKWSKDPENWLENEQLDEIIIPREADVWLSKALKSKNPKIPVYKQNAHVHNMWLLIHGSQTDDVFDFDVDQYDIALLQETAQSIAHNFERIYAFSPLTKRQKFVRVFPRSSETAISHSLEPNDGSYLSVTIQRQASMPPLTAGVRTFDLGGIAKRRKYLPRLRNMS